MQPAGWNHLTVKLSIKKWPTKYQVLTNNDIFFMIETIDDEEEVPVRYFPQNFAAICNQTGWNSFFIIIFFIFLLFSLFFIISSFFIYMFYLFFIYIYCCYHPISSKDQIILLLQTFSECNASPLQRLQGRLSIWLGHCDDDDYLYDYDDTDDDLNYQEYHGWTWFLWSW